MSDAEKNSIMKLRAGSPTDGSTYWNKWKKIRLRIMNEAMPVWAKVVSGSISGNLGLTLLFLYHEGKSLDELLQLTIIQQIRQDRSASDGADGDYGSVDWRPSYWLAFCTFGPPAGPNASKVFRAELSNGPAKKRSTPEMTAEEVKKFFSPDTR